MTLLQLSMCWMTPALHCFCVEWHWPSSKCAQSETYLTLSVRTVQTHAELINLRIFCGGGGGGGSACQPWKVPLFHKNLLAQQHFFQNPCQCLFSLHGANIHHLMVWSHGKGPGKNTSYLVSFKCRILTAIPFFPWHYWSTSSRIGIVQQVPPLLQTPQILYDI
jgi:hypothetical protein